MKITAEIKAKLGRSWKRKISEMWMTSSYPAVLTQDEKALLQSIRNTVGQSALK